MQFLLLLITRLASKLRSHARNFLFLLLYRTPFSNRLEWSRFKVVEMSQIEIAHELHVSKQLISSDVQYLRSQARICHRTLGKQWIQNKYEVNYFCRCKTK
jgi:hypothetical protein